MNLFAERRSRTYNGTLQVHLDPQAVLGPSRKDGKRTKAAETQSNKQLPNCKETASVIRSYV